MSLVNYIITLLGMISGLVTCATAISKGQLECRDIFLIIGVILMVLGIIYVSVFYFLNSDKSFKNSDRKGISSYLQKALDNSGRVAIFSRDMTWVQGAAKNKILEKARRHELIVFVACRNALIDEIIEAGGEVRIYSSAVSKNYDPLYRFTIYNFEKHGEYALVGISDKKKHIIKTLESNSISLGALKDFVRFLIVTVDKER